MQTVADRRVGETEFLFHPVDLPLAADKGNDKIQVFRCQMCKGTAGELSLNGGITRWTVQAGHGQFRAANRTTGRCSVHKKPPNNFMAYKAYNIQNSR